MSETVKIRTAPIPVQATGTDTMLVQNLGASTVYYGDQFVTSSSYTGSIASGGEEAGVTCGLYFMSPGRATIMVTGEVDDTGLVTPVPVIGDYTLTLLDEGKAIEINSDEDVTITVPLEAEVEFPIGSMVEIARRGEGQVAIDAAAGVTFIGPGFPAGVSPIRDLLRQYSVAVLRYCGDDEWWVTGEFDAVRLAVDQVNGMAQMSAATTYEDTFTPIGSIRGVLVVINENDSTEQISDVTYGGEALTLVETIANTNEDGRVYLWFLGTGIPTGEQTVVVTSTGTTLKRGWTIGITSDGDIEVADEASAVDAVGSANPSLSLDPSDTTLRTLCFYSAMTGHDAAAETPQSGTSHITRSLWGVKQSLLATKAAIGATTIGYDISAEDFCHAAVMLKKA